jgi:hypothetical protein
MEVGRVETTALDRSDDTTSRMSTGGKLVSSGGRSVSTGRMPGRIKGKMLAAGSTIEGVGKTSVALSTADVASSTASATLSIADSTAG